MPPFFKMDNLNWRLFKTLALGYIYLFSGCHSLLYVGEVAPLRVINQI